MAGDLITACFDGTHNRLVKHSLGLRESIREEASLGPGAAMSTLVGGWIRRAFLHGPNLSLRASPDDVGRDLNKRLFSWHMT